MTALALGVEVCIGCDLLIRGENYRGYCTEQCYCWHERTVDSDSLERLKVEAAALLIQQEAEQEAECASVTRRQRKTRELSRRVVWGPIRSSGKVENRWTPEAAMTAPGLGLVHIGWAVEGREIRPHLRYPEE